MNNETGDRIRSAVNPSPRKATYPTGRDGELAFKQIEAAIRPGAAKMLLSQNRVSPQDLDDFLQNGLMYIWEQPLRTATLLQRPVVWKQPLSSAIAPRHHRSASRLSATNILTIIAPAASMNIPKNMKSQDLRSSRLVEGSSDRIATRLDIGQLDFWVDQLNN